MTNLDKCKQIIDTETGRVLLYRDEVEAVLTAGDTISRRQAIDALGEEPEVWTGKDEYAQGLNNQWHYDVNALKTMPSAQQEPHWIPCSERLPDEDDYKSCIECLDGAVWYFTENGTMGIGYYYESIKEWSTTDDLKTDGKVIAWMPLPDPYRAEREKE